MSQRVRVLAAMTAGAVLAAAGGSAIAQSGDGPRPVSPSNGKSYKRGFQLTFKVRASTEFGVFLKVSKSKRVGSDGTLASNVYFRKMGLNGGVYTKKVERYAALRSHFINRPGRWYWQAYLIDCSIQDDCNVEGPIRSVRIR